MKKTMIQKKKINFKMKKVLEIALVALVVGLLNGCNYKEQKLRKEFVDKIWIIDEVRYLGNNPHAEDSADRDKIVSVSEFWGDILKPEKDSTFGIYRAQAISVENFKIKSDTLFLKLMRMGELRGLGESEYRYMPYRFVKTGKYSATLFAYDTNSFYFEIYLTNLTDLFNGKPDNSKSKLYQQIKEFTWYPIKMDYLKRNLLDEENPEYYVKEKAFFITDMGNVNFVHGDSNCVYKFIDGDTNNISRFYIYDTLKKEYRSTYYVSEIDNKLRIYTQWWIDLLVKKIDPAMLVNEKDVPLGIRFQSSVEEAKMVLKYNLPLNSISYFFYDLNTLNLLREDSENGKYIFTVVWKDRSGYSDFHETIKILCEITEEGKYNMSKID